MRKRYPMKSAMRSNCEELEKIKAFFGEKYGEFISSLVSTESFVLFALSYTIDRIPIESPEPLGTISVPELPFEVGRR